MSKKPPDNKDEFNEQTLKTGSKTLQTGKGGVKLNNANMMVNSSLGFLKVAVALQGASRIAL